MYKKISIGLYNKKRVVRTYYNHFFQENTLNSTLFSKEIYRTQHTYFRFQQDCFIIQHNIYNILL